MEQYEKGFQRFHTGEDVWLVTSCKFLLASETPRAAKTVHAVSKMLLLLLWYTLTFLKHCQLCCFSLRKISLFSRNRHFVRFIPTYNKRHLSKIWDTVQTCRLRIRSYLSGLRINITFIFMSSSSYLVHAISCRRILLKYRFLECLLSFFVFWFPLFIFIFYFWRPDNLSPVTRYPSPATRHPSPVTRGKVLPKIKCKYRGKF